MGCGSRSWCAGRGWRATRSGGRCGRRSRRGISGAGGGRSSSRLRTRSIGLLSEDPKLPGVRVRELIEPLGFDGGKTIVDDYLREVRPLFLRPRTFSADGLSAGGGLPVRSVAAAGWSRSGMARRARGGLWSRAWGSRAPARARWSSARRRRMCCGAWPAACGRWVGCRRCWCGTARGGCTPAAAGRPSALRRSVGSCGRLAVLRAGRPAGQGRGRAAAGYMETNFEPGRRFANHLDFQLQLDAWFVKANARTHKTLRARPVDRLGRSAR